MNHNSEVEGPAAAGPSARLGWTRAVLLDPRKELMRLASLQWAARQRIEVVCISGRIQDAMHEIFTGRADVILAFHAPDLKPLIRLVGDADETDDPRYRRARRLR